LQIAIIVLAVVTGLIHLDKAVALGFFGGGHAGSGHAGGHHPAGIMGLLFQNLPILFMLNFVAYIVLGGALYLPFFRSFQRLIRWALIVLAALTIIAYFAMLGFSPNPLGYVDKVIELALIVLLVIEDRKAVRLAKE
jgi:hypothetical protein